MREIAYDRAAAVNYARQWAFKRNPEYYNFDAIGGDCTNFASQCIFAGAAVMNFEPTFGWFYRSANDRTSSWTGVEYLYRFLVENSGEGPFAREVPLSELERGDVVQLGRASGGFYHSPVVIGRAGNDLLVAAHTYDAYGKRLSSYSYARARGLHILGVRKA